MVKRKPGEESVEDMSRPWWNCNEVKSAVQSPNCYTAIYKVPNVTKSYNAAYVTRSFYNFDVEVLYPFFENRKKKILQAQIDERKAAGKAEEAAKGDFEKLLDTVKEKRGLEIARQTCRAMLKYDETHRKENLESLTPAGRDLYLGQGGSK
jgi:hypothetical protein